VVRPRARADHRSRPGRLLAALLAVRRGLDTHVLDAVTRGRQPELVRALGATYHHDGLDAAVARCAPDVVIEATCVSSVVFGALAATAPYGIVCLTGVSSGGRRVEMDGTALNHELVLENDAVIGSVNANRRHFTAAAAALALADIAWLERLITRTVPLERAVEAFDVGTTTSRWSWRWTGPGLVEHRVGGVADQGAQHVLARPGGVLVALV
jgi:threonine dehydrogenase-like Zn-dependent dehydrogenase